MREGIIWLAPCDACVVHQNIQLAGAGFDIGSQFVNGGFGANITRKAFGGTIRTQRV